MLSIADHIPRSLNTNTLNTLYTLKVEWLLFQGFCSAYRHLSKKCYHKINMSNVSSTLPGEMEAIGWIQQHGFSWNLKILLVSILYFSAVHHQVYSTKVSFFSLMANKHLLYSYSWVDSWDNSVQSPFKGCCTATERPFEKEKLDSLTVQNTNAKKNPSFSSNLIFVSWHQLPLVHYFSHCRQILCWTWCVWLGTEQLILMDSLTAMRKVVGLLVTESSLCVKWNVFLTERVGSDIGRLS